MQNYFGILKLNSDSLTFEVLVRPRSCISFNRASSSALSDICTPTLFLSEPLIPKRRGRTIARGTVAGAVAVAVAALTVALAVLVVPKFLLFVDDKDAIFAPPCTPSPPPPGYCCPVDVLLIVVVLMMYVYCCCTKSPSPHC